MKLTTDEKNKYLTPKQAAKKLGFSAPYVRKLIIKGIIKAVKYGTEYLIEPICISKVKRQRKPKGNQKNE